MWDRCNRSRFPPFAPGRRGHSRSRHLGHDLSSTEPPDLAGFLPHPELLVDTGRRLVVFGLDEVSNLGQLLGPAEVFGHRDRPACGPWMKSNAAKDVFLTEHDGRVSSGDECPGPAVE